MRRKLSTKFSNIYRISRYLSPIVGVTFIILLTPTVTASLFGPQTPPSLADLINRVKESVVNISTIRPPEKGPFYPFFDDRSPYEFFRKFFTRKPPIRHRKMHTLGSGIVIDENGLILTTNKVIGRARKIKIRLQNYKEYSAKVVGWDTKYNLALLQVEPEPDKAFPKAAKLGDSDKVRVGDWVIAIGNPFGLNHTVTVGIISGKGRLTDADSYEDLLQTDAAINPGNSGGPLFNMKGEVVGISSFAMSRGHGIGFAIPINIVKELLPQLKKGKVVHGWLGVMVQDISPEMAKTFNLRKPEGALIGDVIPNSPADRADLRRGDIIVTISNKNIKSAGELARKIAVIPPGTVIELGIIRGGNEKRVKVTIGSMPEEGEPEEVKAAKERDIWGITVQNLTKEIAKRYGWKEMERGVIITDILPDSPASRTKLRPGDLIKEVNQRKIQNLRDYKKAIEELHPEEDLLLLIKRGDHTFFVAVPATSENKQ